MKNPLPQKPWSRLPEYQTLKGMIYRCTSDKCVQWKDYGGRGIFVCDRWSGENGFEHFWEDMGPRPSDKHSIDRMDNDGPYTPANCRWATKGQQNENRSDDRLAVVVTHGGRTQYLYEWAEEFGVPYQQFYARYRLGWSFDEILGNVRRFRRQVIAQQGTGYRGVTFENRTKKKPYRARARLAYLGRDPSNSKKAKYKNLGRFATAEEAAIAHDIACLKDGKSLEDLNFPLEVLLAFHPELENPTVFNYGK